LPLNASSRKELDRYLLLTLSLEQELEREAWEVASSLINERDNLLAEFEKAGARFSAEDLAEIQRVEQRLVGGLKRMSSQITMQIRTGVATGNFYRAYAPQKTQSAFDRAS